MKISKNELIELNACSSGLERFVQQQKKLSIMSDDHQIDVKDLIGGENTTSDLLWLAGRILPQEKIVRFARDVALINIELIKPYTDKYDLILDFLNGNLDAADAAADAAAYADAAADAAAAAAAYAAAYAAAAAADAAAAAYSAAVYAAAVYAAHAADAAAHAAADAKINELLIELFDFDS